MVNRHMDSMGMRLPFTEDTDPYINELLLENRYNLNSSITTRAYYNIIRPWLPMALRQFMQKKRRNRIHHQEGFIDAELVHYIFSNDCIAKKITSLYPEDFEWAAVLTHDIESYEGTKRITKIMEIEEKHGFRSSWNIVPYLYPLDEGLLREIRNRGHEIGIHGFNHDGKLYRSEKTFLERVPYINKALEKYKAVGFRSPMVHRNLKWLQSLQIEYDSSCFDYDVYQPYPGGVKSIWPFVAGKFVELPYTLPQDHTLFIVLGEKSSLLWKQKSDWIIKHNGVVTVLTHPDYLDNEFRLSVYEDFLEFLSQKKLGWHVLPKEMARRVKDYHCISKEIRKY